MLHGVPQLFSVLLLLHLISGSPTLTSSSSPTTTSLACRQQCTTARRTTPTDDVIKSLTWTKMTADECTKACDKEYVSSAVHSAVDGIRETDNETDDKREDDSSLVPFRRESKFLRIGRDTSAVQEFFPAEAKAKARRPPYLRIGRGRAGDDDSSLAASMMLGEGKRAPASRYVRIGRGGDASATEEGIASPYRSTNEDEETEGEPEVMSRQDNTDRGNNEDLEKRAPASRYVRIGRGGDLEDDVKRAPSSRYVRIGRGSESDREQEQEQEQEVSKKSSSSRYICVEGASNSDQKVQKEHRASTVKIQRTGGEERATPYRGSRSFTRIGRDDNEDEKRASKYIRIGRGDDESEASEDKRASPSRYVRIGRGIDDRDDDVNFDNIKRSMMTQSAVDANSDLFKRTNGYAPIKQSRYIKIG